MTDRDLTALRRASESEPTDAGARAALEQAWLRQGLGWHGEVLPGDPVRDPWFVLPDSERGVYRFATQGTVVQLVYVPGGEVPCIYHDHTSCAPCQGTGRVKIAPMYLGRFPVTWGEYLTFNEHAKHEQRSKGDVAVFEREVRHRPIANVTHESALAFCEWAGLRLPTAQEWRWAALGGLDGPSVGVRKESFAYIARAAWRRSSDRQHWALERASAVEGGAAERLAHEMRGMGLFPWGPEKPTPERCAAADPRYQGRSTAPVVGGRVCGTCQGKRGKCLECAGSGRAAQRSHDPSRPAGVSWCGAHDLVGNVWQWVATDRGETPRALGSSVRAGVTTGRGFFDADGPDDVGTCRDDVGFRVALSAAPS